MRPTVLVVEDSDQIRELIVDMLERHQFQAAVAANGAEALTYLRSGGAADVILLDLMMPVMDGWTFRRAQLQDPWLADIPVIAISALDDRPVQGATPVVVMQKPLDLKRLVAHVKDIVERRRAILAES